MNDLISRQAAIDEVVAWMKDRMSDKKNGKPLTERLRDLPSAQPEIKPISYQDCTNAMMMMWMDDVLTDGEYRRIMDKLNDHESRRENR